LKNIRVDLLSFRTEGACQLLKPTGESMAVKGNTISKRFKEKIQECGSSAAFATL
jgi:hypothetical protein